jgi:DNA replication initiation complex subunit (GINS family)
MSSDSRGDLYESLMEAWRIEKGEEGLAKPPEGLLEDIRKYIGSFKHQLRVSDRGTLTSELREVFLEVVTRVVRGLFELRLRKLVDAAIEEKPLENLIGFECRIYPRLVSIIKEYRDYVEELIEAVAYQNWEKMPSRYELACFLKDTPEFIGIDLESYGPFKAGDIAALPSENARNLELAGVVRVIKVLQPGTKKE